MNLLLCLLLWVSLVGSSSSLKSSSSSSSPSQSSSSTSLASKQAEIAKLRQELNEALEAGEAEAPDGVIVQPTWTKQDKQTAIAPSQVIVNDSTLRATEALRLEINQAVAQQGNTDEVRQLQVALQTSQTGGTQATVGSTIIQKEEQLGSGHSKDEPTANQANVVDAAPLDIDLGQLQQLELSKRRTREMLVLSRIVEDLQFTLGADVTHWLQLQQNGSIYFVGRRSKELLLVQLMPAAAGNSYTPLQTLPLPADINALISYERWNPLAQQQESLVLLATEQQLHWYRLEANKGLSHFWHWPLGSPVNKLLTFAVENRAYLALVENRTLSIYAYDVEALEFWIVQRLQLAEMITALAVLDTGRDLLVALGQTNSALIYAHNMRELSPDAGLQLQLRQQLAAPQIADIAAFQMGGRSYLALGGQRPQILVYVQGQLLPKTVLGQNFGVVELFLPVPVRSYRDDLLLLVQHRVYFDTHTLLQLEVLIWNGEAFEASLPPPCELGPQTTYGAGCMLDEQRDAGLAGAALVRQMQPPLLLVPRQAAPSGLFQLHTQLLPRNSELHDLQEIHDFMRDWVEEQDKLLQHAEQMLHAPVPESEELTTPLLINEGAEVGALHVNAMPWTAQDASMDPHELLQQIRLLKEQLQSLSIDRIKRQPQQLFRYDYDHLDFDIVEVHDELIIEKLNNVPFYVQNATLLFNGSINVQRLELLQHKAPEPPESLPSITQQHLQLSGDLSCYFINGQEWSQFVQQLVWRQERLQLSQLQVEGDIVFEDSLHLSALNKLSFPGDYLWSQGSTTSIVHSPKRFIETLSVNSMDTAGTINGLDPLDAITLTDAQDWPGWVTFTQLEVSEELELSGSAQGRQFEQAPLNPTLLESHQIQAACHFAELIVNGPLQLRGLLDNSSYDSLLGDLALRPVDPNEELLIPGPKQVQLLTLPVDAHVLDGKLSGISIDQFVTKHTEQTLHNLSSLSGYVYFHQLQLSGAYDGVRLDQLLEQALRMDAPLIAPSTRLRFINELHVEQLQVDHLLNDVPLAGGYQTLHEPLHLNQARFEHLQAKQLDVTHNVTGEGHLNGQNVSEWVLNTPQLDIVQVQELILPMGVQATQLQGLDAELLLGFLHQLDELPLLILHGQLQVEHIAVSGAVQVASTLNSRNMAELQREVVWLDQPNDLRTRWRFEQSPIFGNDLFLQGSYNERLLPELLDDIVFRFDQEHEDREELLIVGPKLFTGDVRVLENLDLQALNGIPFNRLANKLQPMEFAGVVHLNGQLHVAQMQLQGELNGQAVSQLEEQLLWQPELGAYVQRGVIQLPQMQLQDLTVHGHLGNKSLEPLQEFFDALLYKQQAQLQLKGHKIFSGRVSIQNGAHITELNDIQLEQLLQQLIFTDDPNEVTLQSPVHFKAPVTMVELQAEQLQGELLNGCNISEWIHDTIRVDRDWNAELPVNFAPGALDNNALQVAQLNHLNLSNVVTLHTAQNLSFPLNAKELFLDDGQIMLHGLVNGRNLTEEYANTLLINAPYIQRVETPLVMQSIYVSGSLVVNSVINGDPNLNLSDVATLNEEQLRLQTPLYFTRLLGPELRTRLHINGFNYSAWHERSLWARGRPSQIISGNWNVRWLRLKQPQPQPQISDQPTHIVYRRQTPAMADLCSRLARIFRMLRLPYQVKQLRRSFTMQQEEDQPDLRRVFALKSPAKDASYLLLNEQGCWTRIYRWNGTHYANAGGFQSGPIDDVAVLQIRNDTNNTNTDQFSFMTSYELNEEQQEHTWNCSGLNHLQTWRTNSQIEIEPMGVPASSLLQLQQQLEEQHLQQHRVPSYQDAIKYLNRPSIESHLRPHLDAQHMLSQDQYETLRERLLQHLSFRLQAEINITQLSIPESDLYDDEHLVEDFLLLMRQLQKHAVKSDSDVFAALPMDTLPLPNNPASVLAARSSQLIWPVLEELQALHARLVQNDSQAQEQHLTLMRQFEHTVRDVLLLANNGSSIHSNTNSDIDTLRLHAVIERLRRLQKHLQLDEHIVEESSMLAESLPYPLPNQWQPVQTIRLFVGPSQRARLLYARLHIVPPDDPPVAPSTAPAAYIQLHHANGTLFQSLAADHQARQLTTLRVRDDTLLAFVEGCCQVRVFMYRGIQGFVPFAEFQAESEPERREQEPLILQLIAMRLPLQRMPGALYTLAIVQTRRVIFYELVVPGLYEPWLHC